MTKKVRLFLTMLFLTLLGGVNAAWGQEVTYDFTGSDWSVTDGVLTNGTVSISGEGTGSFKMNTGYFMMGKSGAYITLPAYDFAVSRIEVVGRSGASSSTKMNVFVGDDAICDATTGCTGTNTYVIPEAYQAAETQYTIKVTSAHNAQITAIKIYKVGGTVVETVATPTFSPGGGIFTESQDVEISCTTDDATIYYTTDGSTPTDESDEYDGAITVSETTTIKAIAVKEGMNNSDVASATYTIKVAEPGWIDFTIQGFTNAEDVTTVTGTNGSVTFDKADGSSTPKWYDSGSAVRIYTKNTITITAEEGKKIGSVEFSITSGSMIADGFNVDGVYSNSIFTLSSPANSIVYTTSSNFRLDKIKINLSSDTREEAGLSYSAENYTATIDGQNEFPTLSNPNELAVSYESTNEDVATIDESGIVTIVAAGTTTISATSEETDTYLAGTASYTLTVTDPNAPGMSADNPYTVDQARAAIDAGTGVTGVYATGIVSEIVTAYNSQFGNITYNISADGSTTADQLQAYRGKSYNGDSFTSEDDIQVGDVVVIYGNLKKYNNTTYEFDANNQLVSLERQAQAKYYVAGDWTNWSDGMVEMSKASASEYSLDGQTVSNGQQFKIVKVDADGTTTTWFGGDTQGQGDTYGIHSGWCTDIALTDGSAGSNFIIQSSKESTYTFTLNVENMTLSVTGWPEPTWYLAGSFATTDAWADDMVEFESQGDGIYTLTKELEANTELKVVNDTQDQWYSTDPAELTKENSSQGIQLSTDNGSNMLIDPAGTYTFTLDANTMTLTVTGWPIVLDGNAFVKVTSTDELTDGYYLIVNEENCVAFNGGSDPLDDNENIINVTIAGKLIAADNATNAAVFMITEGDEGYTISNLSNLAIGNSSDSNGLKTGNYTNAISFGDEGNADIVSAGSYLRYNSTTNAKRFRYYKSSTYTGQKSIALYKLTTVEEIPVTIGAAEYATLYYSDKAFVIPEGVTASIVTSTEGGKITFEELSGVIPAGTAVVLNGPQGTYNFKVVNDETVAPASNLLKGYDTPHLTEGGDIYYKLTVKNDKVGFYWGEENGDAFETGAHKAYLALPAGEAGAKSFYLFSDAVTDGIGAVESTRFNTQGAEIYNLNGQRVSTPQRGIYIINGKKVLVK